MAELIETAKDIEKVILIGVCTSENDDTMESLDELEELVKTARRSHFRESDSEQGINPSGNIYRNR